MSERQLSFGLWYDFRNPQQWRQSDTELYEKCIAQIARAEEMGFGDVWLSEHHFFEDSYSPSMLPIGCAIAARTKTIRIGTSVLLLPLHDPVRVAEDAATLDVISGGRLELGLGVGYRKEEFEGWRIDPKERAQRMEEGIEIIQRLFAGEKFSFDGKHYQYTDIQLYPRPVQQPPNIWIAGFSNVAVRRAARVGYGYIATGPINDFSKKYWAELEKNGKDPKNHEIAGGHMWLIVSKDPKKRWAEAAEHFAYQQNWYGKWFREAGMTFITEVEPTQKSLEEHGCFIVEPDQAKEMIKEYVAATGTSRFYSWAVPPGLDPSWSDEHLELMATEVIPAFR
ncbi:MAG: alkanesulfonate monooxygenase SsuD [Gammaproteobacteria bacterium]|jgi:alkanesulfonate monooxygenase SsuD/methylene tetrahydromethanopterin reductase-like flavin-dependent oxidoreductase (luciferase family)